MLNIVIWISILLWGGNFEGHVVEDPVVSSASSLAILNAVRAVESSVSPEEASIRFMEEADMIGMIDQQAFVAAFTSMIRHEEVHRKILAIADMTLPSTEKRLYLIDMDRKKLLLNTWVAHGQNTGELYARHFSNKEGSHQSSKGLYAVGNRIISPKHGPALLLHGLDEGINCQAESREIIMHKADYVSKSFIEENGHLGRSWGCPAVSTEAMPHMLKHLTNKGLLYIHA